MMVTLTFGADQAAVIPDRTAVLKDKDGDGHNSETHDEHHHPHCWTVRFCRDGEHVANKGSLALTVYFM